MAAITPVTVYATAQSATVASMVYVITAAPDGRLSCPCKGFTYRGTCRHLKALAPAPVAAASVECESCSIYGESASCRHCAGTGIIGTVARS